MEPEEPDSNKLGFQISDGAIGLNFSPMMAKYTVDRKV